MKLTFLGTRGLIDARTRRHRRHTATLVAYRGRRVMIDCGEDWLGHIHEASPHAIVLTHAHPDHANGLAEGAPCPVYATEQAWESIEHYPIDQRRTMPLNRATTIEGVTFTAYPVAHSLRCPAVCYRVTAGRVTVTYAPDVVYIEDRAAAMRDARLYIGDGATLEESFVRKQGDALVGHTPVRTQLTWCEKEGVPEAIITHCGAQIVEGDERSIASQLRDWAKQRGVKASLAFDGMERVLR